MNSTPRLPGGTLERVAQHEPLPPRQAQDRVIRPTSQQAGDTRTHIPQAHLVVLATLDAPVQQQLASVQIRLHKKQLVTGIGRLKRQLQAHTRQRGAGGSKQSGSCPAARDKRRVVGVHARACKSPGDGRRTRGPNMVADPGPP
eukprot:364840-Chlamydomonas_euryale.AAC.16